MEASPGTYPLLLQDEVFTYDVVNNPIEIRDNRIAEEWPAGAKPVSKRIEYDDLYRASWIDYRYAAGDDAWKSPFEAELAAGDGAGDSRRAKPSPHVSFAKRILWQSYQYDWLGNTRLTGDDAKGFYDRSLGTIDNGTANAGPYQLLGATNVGAGSAPDGVNRTGALDATYDDCGNLITLELDRAGPCLGAGTCGQSFVYSWDEVGRLVRARRFDQPSLPADVNAATPAVDLQYHYASGDSRVLKTASDPVTGAQVHTAYVFPSLELRRAEFDTDNPGDYTLDSTTEVGYLFANGVRLARLVHEPLDSAGDGVMLRLFFELGDHLGSTSVALDKATGELVERSTYQAYGGAESSYRPDKWGNFREDYGFTGKESDVEVGLTYFGKRFYNSALQRWVSPDPLEVHEAASGEPNLYSYVSGHALQSSDPLGLMEDHVKQQSTEGGFLDWAPGPQATPQSGTTSSSNGGASGSGRMIPNPAQVEGTIPRVGQGFFGGARERVLEQAVNANNGVAAGAGYAAWLFTAGLSAPEEVGRAVLNFPSYGELAGQYGARAAEWFKRGEYGEGLLDSLRSLESATQSVTGMLALAAPLKAMFSRSPKVTPSATTADADLAALTQGRAISAKQRT